MPIAMVPVVCPTPVIALGPGGAFVGIVKLKALLPTKLPTTFVVAVPSNLGGAEAQALRRRSAAWRAAARVDGEPGCDENTGSSEFAAAVAHGVNVLRSVGCLRFAGCNRETTAGIRGCGRKRARAKTTEKEADRLDRAEAASGQRELVPGEALSRLLVRVAAGNTSTVNDPKKSAPFPGVNLKAWHTSPGGVAGVCQE